MIGTELPADQALRLEITSWLAPHFKQDAEALIKAAAVVEGFVKGAQCARVEHDHQPLVPDIAPAVPGTVWTMELLPSGKYFFRRWIGGLQDEAYRFAAQAEAHIYAAAIISGFEPPRHLCRSEHVRRLLFHAIEGKA